MITAELVLELFEKAKLVCEESMGEVRAQAEGDRYGRPDLFPPLAQVSDAFSKAKIIVYPTKERNLSAVTEDEANERLFAFRKECDKLVWPFTSVFLISETVLPVVVHGTNAFLVGTLCMMGMTPISIFESFDGKRIGISPCEDSIIKLCKYLQTTPPTMESVPRAERRRNKRKGRVVPGSYYRVRRQCSSSKPSQQSGDRSPCQFRFDRRGHKVVLKQRGTVPLAAGRAAVLKYRGYTVVYHDDKIDQSLLASMTSRNIAPPTVGEWLAVRVTWRSASVVGDESLPYVPAIRLS